MEELLQKGVQGNERQRQKLHNMVWMQGTYTLQIWMPRTEEVLRQEEVIQVQGKEGPHEHLGGSGRHLVWWRWRRCQPMFDDRYNLWRIWIRPKGWINLNDPESLKQAYHKQLSNLFILSKAYKTCKNILKSCPKIIRNLQKLFKIKQMFLWIMLDKWPQIS